MVPLVETTLPEGSYVAVALVAGLAGPGVFAGDPQQFGFVCELRDGNNNFMGGAAVVGESSTNVRDVHSITINGGLFVPSGQTGKITLQCDIGLAGQDVVGVLDGAQMVVLQVGGFF